MFINLMVILKVGFWCHYWENRSSRAALCNQLYYIVAGDSRVTWYPLYSSFWIFLLDIEQLCNFWIVQGGIFRRFQI
jgi:hypothetical protein